MNKWKKRYCTCCGEECGTVEVKERDDPSEFWGARDAGRVRIVSVSDCCHEDYEYKTPEEAA